MVRIQMKSLPRVEKNSKWYRWLELATASTVYILANIFDYHFTVYGITNTGYREANPIVKGYMTLFGLTEGLFIYKVLMASMTILAVITIDLVYRKKNVKFRSEYLLYAGAFLTALGGSLWLAL